MNKIQQLQARLSAIKTEGQAIVDAADKDNNGIMSEEQQSKFDDLMAERDQIQKQIQNLQNLEKMEAGTGRVTVAAQPGNALKPAAGESARVTMGVEEDPMRGFTDAADFGMAVAAACSPNGNFDDRLKVLGAPSNFHKEKGSTDGYEVPPQMRDEIWEVVIEEEGLLAAIDPEPTSSNTVGVIADESTPWGATGVQANWAAEGTQFSPSRLESNMKQMQLHKLFAFVLATEEILEDAPRLARRLTKGAGQAIRFKADAALVEGNGTGQPLGWMNSGALVTVAKESGQAADTVVALNIANMYSRLLMAGGRNFWLTNQDVLPQLITMTIGNQPIWTAPNEGMKNAPGGLLLGLPVRFSEHAETVGDLGDIQLINPFGYYAASKAGGIKFASSMHLYFDYDIQAFRWTFRLGGQPLLSAPQTPNKGKTKSHFVTLAART